MFRDGASDPSRVDAWSYGEEYEDFSTDAVHLDLWCLEQLKTLLRNSTSDSELARTLHQPGTIFFLHLLGLDTTGHSYRPHGPEYHRNIRVVDYVVEQTTRVLSEFYGDDDTAYVFTADHGMSSKGNHGDGEPDNTRTPLVVWGAGVGGTGGGTAHNEYSKRWGLSGVRRDVEQADVAVLMVRACRLHSSDTTLTLTMNSLYSEACLYLQTPLAACRLTTSTPVLPLRPALHSPTLSRYWPNLKSRVVCSSKNDTLRYWC